MTQVNVLVMDSIRSVRERYPDHPLQVRVSHATFGQLGLQGWGADTQQVGGVPVVCDEDAGPWSYKVEVMPLVESSRG